jgi:predicted transposase YbfD/YdcC
MSNEITAIPELLKLLEIKGCVVTIDAMGCQAFREDDSRVRDRNAATNLAILRRFALSLCKQEEMAKVGIKIKRLP